MKIRDWKTGGGYLRGIDVSAYQGTINYAKVKSNGIKFAILRAYGSSSAEDSRMSSYANGFKSVGIPCGSYFFCTISDEYDLASADTQANRYANKLEAVFGKGSWGQLTPFIDLEDNSNVGGRHTKLNTTQMLKWVDRFRDTFEARFGNKVKLGIYTSWYFIYDHNNFNHGKTTEGNILKDMPLWMAKWRTTSIKDVGGWTNWVCWQYTDNAYPFSSGQSVGVSSTGLDMNYVESLDDIRPVTSVVAVANVPQPIVANRPFAWLNQNDWISVTWDKPTIKGVTKIELWRNVDKPDKILLGNMSLTSNEYIDRNAPRGTSYNYRIKVFTKDDNVLSLPSNEVQTRKPPATAPTGLIATPSDKKITLSWNPNPATEGVISYSIYQNNVKIGTTDKLYFDVLGLANGTVYNFKITALNDSGILSDYSVTIQGTPVADTPNAPSQISLAVNENKEVTVSWGYIPKEDFSHFQVYVDDLLKRNVLKDTSINVGVLEANISHSFRVVAVDIEGDTTTSTTANLIFHEPAKVLNLQATPKDKAIDLNWDLVTTDSSGNPLTVSNYILYQDGMVIATPNNTTSTYSVTGLENYKSYNFFVEAVSTDGIIGNESDYINVSPIVVVPNQPTNLKATIEDRTTILFKFEHIKDGNFSHYKGYVNDNEIPLDETLLEYRYIQAKPNTDYSFKVIAFDKDGDKAESSIITSRIDIPKTPIGLTATPKDREVILLWELNQESFETKYNVYQNDVKITEIPSGINTYKIENLTNNAIYTFQIEAVAYNGFTSEKSEYVQATPLLVIPNKPNIIMHKIIGNGGVEIAWEHETKELHSHYNLYRDGFLYARNIKDKFYQTDYLEKNKTHSFQVEAFDIQGDGSGLSNSEYVTIYSEFIEPLTVEVGKINENVNIPKPKLYLCKPNKTTIAFMGEAYNINFQTRLADLNEITFTIPYYVDIRNELQINPYYENARERFLVRMEFNNHIEYFIINEIRNDSETNGKEIHAFSLGYELKDKTINLIKEEIFTCYSAFEKALEGQFNWRIGANIKNPDFYWNRESRKFDVTGQTILDFIIQLATSYNALLVWDTVNRVVDLQNPLILPDNKGLKIKYGKYLKSLSKTSSIDEMVTRLVPVGENNLSIRSVTVNGDNALEDFSFFMEGFARDKNEFGRFYLNSKAVVTDPTDPFYTEQGFTNVPMGAIFKNIDKDALTLSTRVDTNSVCYGVINAVNLYRKTNDVVWLNKAKNIAQFLTDRQQTGDFYTARFSFVPNVVDYNSTTGLFESQIGEIDLRVQYLTAIALMEINNIDPNNAYTTLLEGILKLCSMAQNNVVKRATTDNEIEEYMVGATYKALNQSGTATDGVPTYTFTWNQFSISTIDVLAKCWKNYINYFGNATKTDSENTNYTPQDLINNSATFIYEIYNQGKLTMTTTNLPYGFMHYDYADPLNAEGEYVPLAKNMDWINGTWGDTWFATDLMLWEINGIVLLSKYHTVNFVEEEGKKTLFEIANEYRNILFEKRDTVNYPNDIVFFDRYSFDGTGGVGTDTSKAITNTALFLSLEEKLQLTNFQKELKETLIKYQIVSTNSLIDGSYQWAIDSGLIEMKTVGETVNALVETNYSTTISSSIYMSDELCHAILDYQEKLQDNEGVLEVYLSDKSLKQEELVDLEFDLTEKETDLFIVQDLLDSIKAEGNLFYELVNYGGTARTLTFELEKDYQYILMAKTNVVGDISIATNNLSFTFSNTDWFVAEKFRYDRTGETTEQASIFDYNYNLTITGTSTVTMEFQIVRILQVEFDTVGNEADLLLKYNESQSQASYDAQLQLVNDKKTEIANIDTNIQVLNESLSIYNNLSAELIAERDLFVITKEYVDEKISNPEDLKIRAIEKFEELKNPIVTIEIDIVNFLEVLEEHYNWQKLELGTIINIFYEKFGINISAQIINIDYNFNDKTISLKISNVKDLKSNQDKLIEALYGAVSTSNKVALEKSQWSLASEVHDNFESFVNKEFDATKQKIIAGTNESVEISRRGLLIKSDVNSNNMLVANASVLAITNDGGKSYKNAITTDGVIGERIIGKIIAGERLIIENETGSFRVDSQGVTIENQALNIIGGIQKEQIAEGVIPENVDVDLSGLVGTYVDTFTDNNDNTTIPATPIIATDGTQIQFSDVNVDTVNVSFEWSYPNTQSLNEDIDGFMIYIFTSESSATYSFGSNPKNEITFFVKDSKRSIILYNVPKNLYYNFGVEAFRKVNTTVNADGILKSPFVQSTAYNPSLNTAYTGNILGTIPSGTEVSVKAEIITAIRQGQPYDNVTIDSVNGLMATNNSNTERTIINSDGFRIQTNVGGAGYRNVLYGNVNGQLVAEDLLANRLIVNDGTGRELINANTSQINFANFEVVTGQIQATNINMRGMTVTNDLGEQTFIVDIAGNVTLKGNLNVTGGNLAVASANLFSFSNPNHTTNFISRLVDISHVSTKSYLADATSPQTNNIPCVPNEKFTITFWVKRKDGTTNSTIRIAFRYGDLAKAHVGTESFSYDKVDINGWTKLTYTSTAPSNAYFVNIYFTQLAGDGTGTYVNGIMWNRGTIALEYSAHPDDSLSGIITAGHIKSLNGLNIGNGNLVIDANGNVTMKGTLSGATGTFSGSLNGATGSFTGSVTAENLIVNDYGGSERQAFFYKLADSFDETIAGGYAVFRSYYTNASGDATFEMGRTYTTDTSENMVSLYSFDINALHTYVNGNFSVNGYLWVEQNIQLLGDIELNKGKKIYLGGATVLQSNATNNDVFLTSNGVLYLGSYPTTNTVFNGLTTFYSDVRFSGNQPISTVTETGFCGAGAWATVNTSSSICGNGVNFKISRTYKVTTVTLTLQAEQAGGVGEYYVGNCSEHGFWFYIIGRSSATAEYLYWRGMYTI